jgi:conjugative transfer region protein (TIGR03748 family)
MNIKNALFCVFALAFFMCSSVGATYRRGYPYGDVTQVGRYTSVREGATVAQMHPLLAISKFRFNAKVKTVGQAVNQSLQDTGYSLMAKKRLSHTAQEVLKKPLPVTQRELGPITVSGALRVLINNDFFFMKVDHINRLISFSLRKKARNHKRH